MSLKKRALPLDPATLQVLVAHRDEFLAFLERRLRNPTRAEDVLQDAFLKAVGKLHTLEKPESVLPWFYRLLRTTLIDATRRDGARARALDALSAESRLESTAPRAPSACACVHEVMRSIKPTHAEALRRIAIDEVAVKDFAAEAGISSGNAAVRSHRAREALRRGVVRACGSCATRGCLDCTCHGPGRPLGDAA